MYKIYVQFDCFAGKREEFVKRVTTEGVLAAIRAEDGCLLYDYYFSEKNPNELLLIEFWESKEHQQVHMTQPHMAHLQTFNGDYIKSAKFGEFEIK